MIIWPATIKIGSEGSRSSDILPFTACAKPLGAKATVVPSRMAASLPALIMASLTRVIIGSASGRAKEIVLLATKI